MGQCDEKKTKERMDERDAEITNKGCVFDEILTSVLFLK